MHLAHLALWGQIIGAVSPSEEERDLAERIRIAASAVADSASTIASMAKHPSLAGVYLGRWAQLCSRTTPSARPSRASGRPTPCA
jgi:hypothetical protein